MRKNEQCVRHNVEVVEKDRKESALCSSEPMLILTYT